MASIGLQMKAVAGFTTVGLWVLSCFGVNSGDAGLAADGGTELAGSGSPGGATSSIAGAAGYTGLGTCGTGGRYNGCRDEGGSSDGEFDGESFGGSTSGMGGSGGGLPPCPNTPEAPGAALLRVPSVLPEGMLGTTVLGLSSDGATVVGGYDQIISGPLSPGQVHLAFRWTVERGIETLETPDTYTSDARATNTDGSVVVGTIQNPSALDRHAVVWTSAGVRELELLPGVIGSNAVAVNADGSVIVGNQYTREDNLVHTLPVRWTPSGIELLDNPAQPYGAFAVGASADGNIVAGAERNRSIAVRWVGSGAMETLGSSNSIESEATAISSDGSTLVGWASSPPDGTQAVRWQGTNAELLGFAEGTFERTTTAWAVDADGSTIGLVYGGLSAVWRRGQGIQRLDQLLQSLGEDLSPWTLDVPYGISADGRLLAGTGRCGDGSRGFVVRLSAGGDAEPDGGTADAGR